MAETFVVDKEKFLSKSLLAMTKLVYALSCALGTTDEEALATAGRLRASTVSRELAKLKKKNYLS